MKVFDASGALIHVCDFCGASDEGGASMFVSRLSQQNVAVCKPCVDAAPFTLGRVTTWLTPPLRQPTGMASLKGV